jgi:hypothetical protein
MQLENISVEVRLRPVRFAFMARPDDKADLLRIFQTNTCLWGGLYNPIIPFFKRVPAWWERNGIRFDSATQIVNGYLDYFEPDFLVETDNGIADGFGVDPKRIIPLAEILPPDDQDYVRGRGQSVLDLYRKLYKEEFQFVRRHDQRVIEVKATAPYDALAACLFGAFPKAQNLKYFATAFKDVFDPEECVLDAAMLDNVYKSNTASPLRLGQDGLEVDYNDHADPTLFILDAGEPKDLLDFWNYRATHRSAVAIPVEWLPQLSESCRAFILRNYRPLPGNPHGVMIRPHCLFSRSIPETQIKELHEKYLMVDKPGANAVQVWYPPIWRPSPQFMIRRTRPTIAAVTKSFDVQVDIDEPRIRFESLYPDFADRFGSEDRWANVIRLRDWSRKDRVATVFPTDFRRQAVPRFGLGREFLLSTNEGLVNFPRFKAVPRLWSLPEGKDAIALWLKQKNITSRLSESGRATEQIIQTLGGFWGVKSLSHKGIIELLAEMARGSLMKSAHQAEFKQKVKDAVGKDVWREKVFETLVERKAVELGQELNCSKCGSWGWYALGQLNQVINCHLCLRPFDYPITAPNDSRRAKWAYRVIGPFALPNYANGGYAAALAIRFFGDVIGGIDRSEIAWSPGQELTFPDGEKAEADFLLWYQRKHTFGPDHATEIVFGEAKSFGKDAFKENDIRRMKMLAEQYPGAVIVFATLKEAAELSKDEVKRIRKLADWGREYNKENRETRAPVIVLTGTELFTPHWLEEIWKQKGGLHKQLVEPAYVQLERLKTLADLTQQLYLDMPSYGAWQDAKWKKRKAMLEKRKAT